MKKILITGTAGFIGFHLVNKLLKETDWQIVGLDNINDYYDVNLKYARLKETGIARDIIDNVEKANSNNPLIQSSINPRYRFIKLDLVDKDNIIKLFEDEKFNFVVNLAAQPGVRYSLINPSAYIASNIVGFANVLDASKNNEIEHFIFASSSSVYGHQKKLPFSESDNVEKPISLYAATKRSNELLAYTYSHLYGIKVTGLRFFTVYGPWGRPDMAYFKFANSIFNDKPIQVFNNGNLERDFTYINDIIDSLTNIVFNNAVEREQYKIYNIGNHIPIKLLKFIEILEKLIGKKSQMQFTDMQPGDVYKTYADVEELMKDYGFAPSTELEVGLAKFINWYREYNLLS